MRWLIEPSTAPATSSLTASRSTPRVSGGARASSAGSQFECQRAHRAPASAARPARGPRSGRSAAPLPPVALDQLEQPGHALLGRRPIGDVLAGERLLVHLRAHVTGVDRIHPQRRLLGGEDRRQLLERCLRGAVAAPARVGLERRVGGHVDDRAAGGISGSASWVERQRRLHIDVVDALELVERIAARARAAGSGRAALALLTSRSIWSPAASTSAPRCHSSVTSPAIATTSVIRPSSRRPVRAPALAGVDHEPPFALCERSREGQAKAARGSGDDCCGMTATLGAGRSRFPAVIGPRTSVRIPPAPRAAPPACGQSRRAWPARDRRAS